MMVLRVRFYVSVLILREPGKGGRGSVGLCLGLLGSEWDIKKNLEVPRGGLPPPRS